MCFRLLDNGHDFWSFGNNFYRNVVICGVDNSSSTHTDNLKSSFLVWGEEPIDNINGSFGTTVKGYSINFGRARSKFSSSLHYNSDNSYLLVNGKKSVSIKLIIKKPTFLLILSRKHLLKELFTVFQSNSIIDNSDISSIHKYFMPTGNIK